MPVMKLTQRNVDRLRAPDPSGKQVVYWDPDLRGFGLLVSGISNAKTYIVQREVKGKTQRVTVAKANDQEKRGKTRRLTVAKANVLKLDDARKRAEKKLDDLAQGRDPKDAETNPTLQKVLDDYIVDQDKLRPRSVDAYKYSLKHYLRDWLDKPLRDITYQKVKARHREIPKEIEARQRAAAAKAAAQYRARAKRAATEEERARCLALAKNAEERKVRSGLASANAAMRAVRVLWNFARTELELDLPDNPVALRKKWHDVPPRDSRVMLEDMPRFYEAVMQLENEAARDYLLFLLFTGLRRGEAACLTWKDISLAQKTITIPAARTKANRKLVLPMTDFVHDLLVTRGAKGREVFVFPAASKSRHIEEPAHPLALVAEATGIQVTAHDLRRTFITAGANARVSMVMIKALVNHSLGKDVTAGYIHPTLEELSGPAQVIANKLKEQCGVPEVAGENVSTLHAC
jgi:integrase